MMLNLKAQLETKENSVVFLLPEDICAFTLKRSFCVLEVQPSKHPMFIVKDSSSSKPIV